MNKISELIDMATAALDNSGSNSSAVGNRPHFPMLIVSNNMKKDGMYEQLYEKLRKLWPSAISKIVFSAFEIDGSDSIRMRDAEGEELSQTQLKDRVDEINMLNNVFDDMSVLNIYNIIDTSVMESVEEFKQAFSSIDYYSSILIGNHRTMAIVLLDDSSVKHDAAIAIKRFLAGTDEVYDGVVVISNRLYNNAMCPFNSLYRLAANVLILSDNDAVSSYDDEEFSERTACLYNKNYNTVSYSLFERPNRDIALQIIDTILLNAENCINNHSTYDNKTWKEKTGITDRISACDTFLRQLKYSFDIGLLEHIALKSCEYKGEDVTYGQFREYTFDDALDEFINNFFNEIFVTHIDINKCLAEFEADIKNNVSLGELLDLPDDSITSAFGELTVERLTPNLNLAVYIREYMFNMMRKNILYPKCEELLRRLQGEARKTKEAFEHFKNTFSEYKPADGFAQIGTMYKVMTEVYVNSDAGKKDNQLLLTAGNTDEQFVDIIMRMVKKIVSDNQKKFSMTFIQEWSERLNLSGDVIYTQIHNTLDSDANNKIHLSNLHPVNDRLHVYMFHTANSQGEEKTELYSHLSAAYKEAANVQFFNTGFDDSLEVLKFFDCGDDKMTIMSGGA